MFRPFDEKPMNLFDGIMDWKCVYPKSYSKHEIDPYTKIRIVLMNGIETEAAMFGHQFHRHCPDNDIRRDLAMLRRVEQLQQKHLNWLKPLDESQIETTIGYEHVAVDLTAWLAQNEPDKNVKEALDFALLEDFDHLFRFSNLLNLDKNIPAHSLTKSYLDITPGRPTIAEHRHPNDTVRYHINAKTADIRTKLNALIITAGEQQTMNFYNNLGNSYDNDYGRKLYLEIAMIEEEHVTQYGSLLDPNSTWLENLLLHEYMECYLYYSFYQDELDEHLKKVWELHLNQEIAHLHKAAELLSKYEKKHWDEVVTADFPDLLEFHDTKDYVRKVLAEQIELTACKETLKNVNSLPAEHDFFAYQKKVNHDVNAVESHVIIERHIKQKGEDYRDEEKPNPVPGLADRKSDNAEIARTKKA
ncbi:MAG: hypothetical protein FWG91_10945 [Lachnospiraceae bacterium]|nr:hypothetical protein [Lachnospiraceae bacterium]